MFTIYSLAACLALLDAGVRSIIKRRIQKLEGAVKKEEQKLSGTEIEKKAVVKASGSNVNEADDKISPKVALERQASVKSKSSEGSHDSDRKKEKPVTLDPPAPRLREAGEYDDDEDEELEEHAFDHPSTYAEARWIWLPHDELGFSGVLLEELKGTGSESIVEASDVGATMDVKGIVECSRNPPDEDWTGGYDK